MATSLPSLVGNKGASAALSGDVRDPALPGRADFQMKVAEKTSRLITDHQTD